MSTRASILVKEGDEKCYIYHHCDGYPDGVGLDLKEYLEKISSWYMEDIVNELIKGKCANDSTYEWTSGVHGDESYFYLIDCDNKVLKCYTESRMLTLEPKDPYGIKNMGFSIIGKDDDSKLQ